MSRDPAHPADATARGTQPEFRIGEGKISGVLAVFLAWLGLGAALALRFPQFLSTPSARDVYPMGTVRLLIDVVLLAAIGLGVLSLILSQRKSRGVLALALAGGGLALGGSRTRVAPDLPDTPYVALDGFLLSLFPHGARLRSPGARLRTPRSARLSPRLALGPRPLIIAYLAWASFQGVFIHSNLRFRFGPLRYLIATPQFHHWHHSATLYNRNFAVHLPIIDKLFGTYHLPGDEWPPAYGIEGSPVPEGYVRQLIYPIAGRRGPKARGDASSTPAV